MRANVSFQPPVRRGRSRAPTSTLLALLIASATGAQAQTWTGGGVTSNWSDGLNWQGLLPPISSATTAVTFAGNLRLTSVQNLGSPFTLNSLTFAAGAGAYQLSGNALRFDGSNARLVQNSSTAVSIFNQVQVAANMAVEGVGTVTLGNALMRAAGTNRDTLVLTKRGAGTLVLAAAGTYDATLRIDGGLVLLRDAMALQNANVALNIDNGLSFGSLVQATLGGLSGSGAVAVGSTVLTIGGSDSPGLYSGRITGTTGGVVKTGSGTARWSGSGSQFDRLRVGGGRLQLEGGTLNLTNATEGLNVGTGLPIGGPGPVLEVSGGTTLSALGETSQVDGAAGTQMRITGAGSRVNTGFQMLVGNAATGALQVDGGGTLAANTFLVMGVGNASNGALQVNAGGTVTSAGGVLGLRAGSTGTAEVSGTNARWSTGSLGLGGFDSTLLGGIGALTVRDGGLAQVTGPLTFWTAGSGVTVNGGTLRAGSLDGAAGLVTLQADPTGGAALVLDGGSDGSFAGRIVGAGSLLKTGTGAQTLSGAGLGYTGVTTIRGGRIVIGNPDALRFSQVRIDVDNGLDVNGGAGVGGVALGSLAGSGALALGSTQLILGEDNRNSSYGGMLSGAGALLVKQGTGTQTLTGAGSVLRRAVVRGGGTLAVDGGSLSLNSGNFQLPALEVDPGGRVEVRNGGLLSTIASGQPLLRVDGNGSEVLVDGTGSRLQAGDFTYVGVNTTGRLVARNGGSYSSAFALVVGFDGDSKGTASFESGAQGSAAVLTLGTLPGAEGRVEVTGAGTRLLVSGEVGLGGYSSGQLGGIGALVVGAGAQMNAGQIRLWTPGSSMRIDGGSVVAGGLISTVGGRVTLASDPGPGQALTLGSNVASFAYNGDIDGDGSLVKIGVGTQVLSGRNTFTGLVRVQGGTLEMQDSAASEYDVRATGTLRLGERNLGVAVVQAARGGTVVYGDTTLSGGTLIGPGNHDIDAVRRIVGTRLAGGTTLTPASSTTFVGVVSEGTVNLLAGRTMTWTSGSNPGGSFIVGGTANVSNFSSAGQLVVPLDGTLRSASGNLVLGGGSRTTIGAPDVRGGVIELLGGGTLQLNGGLLVNNGRITGPVEVNYGGLAKGAGEYGQVTVNDGGRFSPGNSPGRVTTGDATWGAGGTLLVELAAAQGTAGLDWDLWSIHGSLGIAAGTTANSRFTVSLQTLNASNGAAPLAGFDAQRPWQWQIVDTDGGIFGFDLDRVALDTQGFMSPLAGGTLRLSVQDGDLYLVFAPVPEPQTWALLLGGLGVLGWAAKRRRVG